MKPETRARTSTLSTATNRPVYSSHSVICFCNGRATVTGGGGGAAPAACLLSQPVSAWAASARKPNKAARMMTAGMGLSSGIASIIAYNPTKMLHRDSCPPCYTRAHNTIMLFDDEAPHVHGSRALYRR